jgi:hypothetical protein
MFKNENRETKMGFANFSSAVDKNKAEISRIEEFKNMKITPFKQYMVVGALGLGAILLTQILTGMVVIVGIVVLGVAGMIAIRQFSPTFQQKLRNEKLNMMIKEAKENAIARLETEVLSNTSKLKIAKDHLNKMGAHVRALESDIDFDDTSKKTEKKIEIFKSVETAYHNMQKDIKTAEEKSIEFEEKVADYKDLEKFINAAMAFSITDENTKLNDMLSLESFAHIEDEFNTAIVSIEYYNEFNEGE